MSQTRTPHGGGSGGKQFAKFAPWLSQSQRNTTGKWLY